MRPETHTPPTELASELEAVEKGGRLRWYHVVAITLCLIATLAAWRASALHQASEAEAQFDIEATRAVTLLEERMALYEYALWSGVSAVQSHGGDVDYETWKIFAESQNIEDEYPGTNGIGVIHEVQRSELDSYLADQRTTRPEFTVHPDHELETLYPISYIEPVDINAAAVGLDIAHETNRLNGILDARDTGTAQVTGPIVLVQDEKSTPGFLFYAPFYGGAGNPASVDQRREQFSGAVYAPFVVESLMDGVLAKNRRSVGLRVTDGAEVLYDEHRTDEPDFVEDASYRREVLLPMYGREWVVDIRSTASFDGAGNGRESTTVLVSGLALTTLLTLLFWRSIVSNRRAIRLAEDVTVELRHESELLAKTNAELANASRLESIGQLAAGVAHEINTPIQFVSDNTVFLQDSFEEIMASIRSVEELGKDAERDHPTEIRTILDDLDLEFLRDEIPGALEQSKEGLDRVAKIVRAMKDFSHPGMEIAETDLNTVVQSTLAVSGSEWKYIADVELDLDSELPLVMCSQGQLRQVILNLVVNAAHAMADRADQGSKGTLTIRTAALGPNVRIDIGDNGTGMTPDVRDKIFERFFTTKDVGVGTGQGLAIAWEVVTGHGGTIEVESTPGEGTTFSLWLPIAGDVSLPEAA